MRTPCSIIMCMYVCIHARMYVTVLSFCVQYYTEANEADAWMNEKAGVASSQDYGKDEDAATKALTKHKVCTCVYQCCIWAGSFGLSGSFGSLFVWVSLGHISVCA